MYNKLCKMFDITFFKAKVELSYFRIIISVGYLKNIIFVTVK